MYFPARLPFKPLDQKPQIISSTSPLNHKKRKLSDGESPSAKPPKSHKPVVEKPPPMVDHDPEVSSSSETENIPVRDVKVRIRNTLERFVRKNSQEEISSTNTDDCIDMTDNFDNDSNSNKDKTTDDEKNICMESNEAASISKETETVANKQEPASSGDGVVESSKSSENKENKQKPEEDKDSKPAKTETPESDADENKSQKTPKKGIDAFLKKATDKNLESVEKLNTDKVQEQSEKTSDDLNTDVEMEEEDKDDDDDESSEDADDEGDSSTINCQQSPKTPARKKPNTDLTKTPVCEKPDSFKTPSRSPDGSTPTSAKQKRPVIFSLNKFKSYR